MTCNCGSDAARLIYTNNCAVCGKKMDTANEIEDVYKLRAECMADVGEFFANLWPGCELLWARVDKDEKYPDVKVSMKIKNTDLDELRIALAGIPDGHVMFETVNHAEHYNGERWFKRYVEV